LIQKTQKKNLDYPAVGKNKQKVKQNIFDLLDIATTVQKKNLDRFAHLPQIVSD
jgi:hypothetical protein